jgi:hypothetical protein
VQAAGVGCAGRVLAGARGVHEAVHQTCRRTLVLVDGLIMQHVSRKLILVSFIVESVQVLWKALWTSWSLNLNNRLYKTFLSGNNVADDGARIAKACNLTGDHVILAVAVAIAVVDKIGLLRELSSLAMHDAGPEALRTLATEETCFTALLTGGARTWVVAAAVKSKEQEGKDETSYGEFQDGERTVVVARWWVGEFVEPVTAVRWSIKVTLMRGWWMIKFVVREWWAIELLMVFWVRWVMASIEFVVVGEWRVIKFIRILWMWWVVISIEFVVVREWWVVKFIRILWMWWGLVIGMIIRGRRTGVFNVLVVISL